ncbi:MAG: MBL fold metallo-hydrolase [Vulcanimicrobiota bacterium]
MEVEFWGTRGSVPAPGESTVKYGGNTTCLEIRLANGAIIIIDAGTGIRKLGHKLIKTDNKKIDIFLTHPHWDHIQGFPFFAPMYDKNSIVRVHGWATTNRKVQNTITYQMEGTYFPVDYSQLAAEIDFIEIDSNILNYEGATLSFIRCNHPVICHSIKFEEQDRTMVFMTDNELDAVNPNTTWEEFVNFCKNANLLIHDAQYTPVELDSKKGWGHSSFIRVLELANQANVEKLCFFHHDPDHSDKTIDDMVESARKYIKEQGYKFVLTAAKENLVVEV